MIFDVAILNPPYDEHSHVLDTKFVYEVNKICDYQVVVHPGQRFITRTKTCLENILAGHFKAAVLFDMNATFHISTKDKVGCISVYDNIHVYDKIKVENDLTGAVSYTGYDIKDRTYYWKTNIIFSKDFVDIAEKRERMREELVEKYGTMVNDAHGFIYEENNIDKVGRAYGIAKTNDIKLGRVKRYLKEGTYKYCVWRTSWNHEHDRHNKYEGQDPDVFFNGQLCWLMNDESVQDNLKYWLDCPLCDMWRRYHITGRGAFACAYAVIPAFDFEMDTDTFREEVNRLNDFAADEIQVLKKYKIRNIDRYDF